jgi:hypothetical protein
MTFQDLSDAICRELPTLSMAASVVFTAVKVLMANEPPVFKALNLLLAP